MLKTIPIEFSKETPMEFRGQNIKNPEKHSISMSFKDKSTSCAENPPSYSFVSPLIRSCFSVVIANNAELTEEGVRGLIRSAAQAVETNVVAPSEIPRQNALQSANAMFDPNNASPNTEFIQLLKHRMSVYFLNLDEGCDS
jgi:hypothetical protein